MNNNCTMFSLKRLGFFIALLLIVHSVQVVGQGDDKAELTRLNASLRDSLTRKDLDGSLQAAERIVALSNAVYGANTYDAGIALENVGIIHQMRKKYPAALESLQKAMTAFAGTDRRSQEKKIGVLSRIGVVYFVLGKKKEEEQTLNAASEFAITTFGKGSRESLAPTLDLARFYGRNGKLDFAHGLFLEVYEIGVARYGANASQIAAIDDAVVCTEFISDTDIDLDDSGFWRDRTTILKDRTVVFANMRKAATYIFPSAYPNNTYLVDRGKVVVKILLDESGNIAEARAICEVTKFLSKIAEDSAKQSKFRPVVMNGKPVKAWGFIVYDFNR